MIDPKEITINDREFIISKFPALAGREIITNYPISAIPKLGDYKINEEIAIKALSYVAVKSQEGNIVKLTTRALIDNHTGSWETLMKLEVAIIEYNCSFFQNGRASTFLEGIAQKLPALISKILKDLSAQSSQKEKQPSTN